VAIAAVFLIADERMEPEDIAAMSAFALLFGGVPAGATFLARRPDKWRRVLLAIIVIAWPGALYLALVYA